MKWLIIGSAGYVGSNLTRMVRERGGEVAEFDVATNKTQNALLPTSLIAAIAGARPDVIAHLAGTSHHDTAHNEPLKTIKDHIVGTATLLDVCREVGYEGKILVASSNNVYGACDDRLLTEESPLNQRTAYGVAKIGCDLLAQMYAQEYGLKTIAVRHTNSFGPNDHPDHLIPEVITQILAGGPVKLRSNGLTWNSYLHIEDVCMGYILAAENGEAPSIYNFSGPPLRTIEMVRIIARKMGYMGDIHVGEGQETTHAVLDSSRARGQLGWMPERGIDDVVKWYRNEA